MININIKFNVKFFLLIFASSLFLSCSTSRYNTYITSPLPVEKLKKDVDKAQKLLVKYHPKLDWYIAADSLNSKFDSLRNNITAPMTSRAFFENLSPVIYSVRQGHNRLRPALLKLTSQQKANSKGIKAPIAQFVYMIDDNRLFIVENQSADSIIQAGTEVIAINGESVQEILKKCYSSFTSDGYNTTFFPRFAAENFPKICTALYPEWKDSIYFTFQNDEIVRKIYGISVKESKEQKKPDVRTLSFLTTDSIIAIMKISHFRAGNYQEFYQKSFATLSAAKTQTLVIDLRNNPGGALREISYLYSFLTDSAFIFTDKAEVTSPYSCAFHGKSLSVLLAGKNILSKFVATLLYPIIYTTSSTIDLLSVSKEQDGKYYYSYSSAKWKQPNRNRFTGNIYVLANGGSFSASCILLSNLQGSKRAFVVGEETGGAYNGTVAGRMITKTLPASKLRLTVGMQAIQPHYKSSIEGRGIFPDKEIVPTIENRINQQDHELEWIKNLIIANRRLAFSRYLWKCYKII